MSTFHKSLAKGRLAESEIARYLRLRGWTVIPVYEIEEGQNKGPQIFMPDEEAVAPDLLVWKDRRFRFIEAKNKSVFSWYRKTGRWQTGIDNRHYKHYLRVGQHFDLEIWLMFLHESSEPDPKDRLYDTCPSECPTGLFGSTLKRLQQLKPRFDPRWGKSGMVYWNHEDLQLICALNELRAKETDSFVFERTSIAGIVRPLPFEDLEEAGK